MSDEAECAVAGTGTSEPPPPDAIALSSCSCALVYTAWPLRGPTSPTVGLTGSTRDIVAPDAVVAVVADVVELPVGSVEGDVSVCLVVAVELEPTAAPRTVCARWCSPEAEPACDAWGCTERACSTAPAATVSSCAATKPALYACVFSSLRVSPPIIVREAEREEREEGSCPVAVPMTLTAPAYTMLPRSTICGVERGVLACDEPPNTSPPCPRPSVAGWYRLARLGATGAAAAAATCARDCSGVPCCESMRWAPCM